MQASSPAIITAATITGDAQTRRDGQFGTNCFGMLCHSPASLLEGVKEVRSPGRTKGRRYGAGGVLGIQPHYDLLFLTPTNRGVPGGCA